MGTILKGRLKVATSDPNEIITGTGQAQSYAILHPETDPYNGLIIKLFIGIFIL